MLGFYDWFLFSLLAASAAAAPTRVVPLVRGWPLKGVLAGALCWVIATRAPLLSAGAAGTS